MSLMDRNTYIQLILLCVVNIFFTCCGIFLNSLVILSFIKSSQLRKKASYFMIMILSCVDLFAVATNHPTVVIFSVSWLNEKYGLSTTLSYSLNIGNILIGFSLLTLFVMSIDRYLAIAYPLFHRVSVTKRRLLTLLAFLFLFDTILIVLAFDDWIITFALKAFIFFAVISPPFLFINIKLLMIVRRERRNKAEARKTSTIVKLKNISTCLLAVACFVLLSITAYISVIIHFTEKPTSTNRRLSWFWAATVTSMNSTFNCLIFFWKNKILRQEGMKILKLLK